MYTILQKQKLNEGVYKMVIKAPLAARKCLAGQFVIIRPTEEGERIPLTIAGYDREEGSITVIFQAVGKTTAVLSGLEQGEAVSDLAGPLGKPSELEGFKRVAVIGGGLGCAIAYPQAKALHEMGAHVDMIAGFRNKDLVILEEEMRAVSNNLYIMTDDGSAGEKGLVTAKLEQLLNSGEKYDAVLAIGPLIMMKFVAKTTKPYGVKTIVSMNPIMIDGTGMCGGCRLTVGGQTKFACVDGPDFDGHEVDFDEAIRRLQTYKPQEQTRMKEHRCRMEGMRDE